VHNGLSADSARVLNAVDVEDFVAFAAGLGIMQLGAAALLIKQRGTLRWLGGAGVLIGIAIFTPLGFFGFLGSLIWIALAGIALSIGDPRARAHDATTTTSFGGP
jgi:hypothetical protein